MIRLIAIHSSPVDWWVIYTVDQIRGQPVEPPDALCLSLKIFCEGMKYGGKPSMQYGKQASLGCHTNE